MQFWQIFPHNADNQGKAVALLAAQVPYYGALAALYVPVLGAVLLLISSNSGVFGSSRIAYAMSTSNLLPSIFQRVHAVFRTPVISIVFFSTIALIELFFAAAPSLFPALASLYAHFFHGENGLEFLADLYAFGAATSYSFVFLGLIALRLSDPLSPRKFKIPLNIPHAVSRRTRRASDHRRNRLYRNLLDFALHAAHARAGTHLRPELAASWDSFSISSTAVIAGCRCCDRSRVTGAPIKWTSCAAPASSS